LPSGPDDALMRLLYEFDFLGGRRQHRPFGRRALRPRRRSARRRPGERRDCGVPRALPLKDQHLSSMIGAGGVVTLAFLG
jgi:hypothetical protein